MVPTLPARIVQGLGGPSRRHGRRRHPEWPGVLVGQTSAIHLTPSADTRCARRSASGYTRRSSSTARPARPPDRRGTGCGRHDGESRPPSHHHPVFPAAHPSASASITPRIPPRSSARHRRRSIARVMERTPNPHRRATAVDRFGASPRLSTFCHRGRARSINLAFPRHLECRVRLTENGAPAQKKGAPTEVRRFDGTVPMTGG